MADVTSTLMLLIRAKDEASPVLGTVGRSLSLLGGSGGLAAGGAVGGLGLLAVGAGIASGAALKLGADFQQTMNKVQNLTNTTAAQMPALTKGLLDEAHKVPFTAQQLAQGLYTVASAGFDAQSGMKVVDAAFKEAAIGGLKDPAPVLDVLTTALSNYKAPASEAARYTAILQESLKLGKGELGEFASSFSKVLPTAAAMGLGLDQVGNAMAVLTNNGERAQNAAQGLNRIMSTVLKPTAGGLDTARMLGITDLFTPANLKKVGLAQFVTEIEERIKPLGAAGQTMLAKLFGQQNATRDMRILIQHYDELNKNQQQFNRETQNGAIVQAAFTQTMGGFNQSLAQAKADIGASATALGLQLLPAATSLVNTLGPAMAGSVTALSTALGALGLAGASAGPSLSSLGNTLHSALSGLGTFLDTTVLPAVKRAIGTMLTWWQQHGAEVARFLNAAAADAGKFGTWLVSNMGSTMLALGGVAQVGWGAVKGVFAVGQTVLEADSKKHAPAILDAYKTVMFGFDDIFQGMSETMVRFLDQGLQPALVSLHDWGQKALKPLEDWAANVLMLMDALKMQVANKIVEMANGALHGLNDLLSKLPDWMPGHQDPMGKNFNPIAKPYQDIGQALTNDRQGVLKFVGLQGDQSLGAGPLGPAPNVDSDLKKVRDLFKKNKDMTLSDLYKDFGDQQAMAELLRLRGVQGPTHPAAGTPGGGPDPFTVGSKAMADLLKKFDAMQKGALNLSGPTGGPPLTTPPGLPETGDGTGTGAGGVGDSLKQLKAAVADAKAIFGTDMRIKGTSQDTLLGDVSGIKQVMVTAMQQGHLYSTAQIANEIGKDMDTVGKMFAHLDMRKLEAQLTLSRDHLQDLLKQGDKASADRERQHFITLDTQKYLAQGLPADLAKQLATAEGKKIGTGGITIGGGLGSRGLGATLTALLRSEKDTTLSYGGSDASFLGPQRGGDAQARIAALERQLANADKQLAATQQTNSLLTQQLAAFRAGLGHAEKTAGGIKEVADHITRPRAGLGTHLAAAGMPW